MTMCSDIFLYFAATVWHIKELCVKKKICLMKIGFFMKVREIEILSQNIVKF